MPGLSCPGAEPNVPNWLWNSPAGEKRSTRSLNESSTYTRPSPSTATPPMPPTTPVVGLALRGRRAEPPGLGAVAAEPTHERPRRP